MNDSMEFNLELALKGYPIRTRFGHPVVLNKVDKKENKLYVDEFLMDDIFYINSGDYYPHEGDDNSVMFLLTADRWINHPELMSGLPTEWRNKANALNIKEDDNPILFFFKEKNKLE